MDPAKLKAALDAIEAGDPAAILAALKDLITSQMGEESAEADPAALADPAATPADPAKDPNAPEPVKASKEFAALQVQLSALQAERDEQDLEARQELVGELVKLGVETPATAWLDASKRLPAKRFSAETVKELRARVTALRAVRPTPAKLEPPTGGGDDGEGNVEVKTKRGNVTLSAREVENCATSGVKLEQYAENKSIRESARKKGTK
jgi:hypothetical protein